jgi:N-acetylglutamate synthase/N-acetylornithine aminotransferase
VARDGEGARKLVEIVVRGAYQGLGAACCHVDLEFAAVKTAIAGEMQTAALRWPSASQ